MPTLNTPLEVYKLLPKTNCGSCGSSTCMAFAAAVIKQERTLEDCRSLAPDVLARFGGKVARQVNLESIQVEQVGELRKKIAGLDLASRARALGGRITGRHLVVSCLGRDFEVDARGVVSSQCHTHAWFSIPLLDYIVTGAGADATGQWLPFRELAGGQKWSGLFDKRCERPLHAIADTRPDLFGDLVSMFSGVPARDIFHADVSVVLYPLPRVPLLICYWRPEEDMESKLHVFFDKSAEQNLPLDSLFTLGTGIAMMLEKIMARHS
jgi:hypothetical protein